MVLISYMKTYDNLVTIADHCLISHPWDRLDRLVRPAAQYARESRVQRRVAMLGGPGLQ